MRRTRATLVAFASHVALLQCLGCGSALPPRSRDVAPAPLTDDDACARLCDRMRACGGAPSQCEAACDCDRARLKVGFTASLVGCVEKELDFNVCSAPDEQKRSGIVALCYSATLNVFASRDRGNSGRNVLSAACRRRKRCAPDANVDEGTCIAELESHAKAAVMLLGVARDELVEGVAKCIDASACDETDPVPRCMEAMSPPKTPEPAVEPKPPEEEESK